MCGIAGWLGNVADGDALARGFAEALRHRGPDAHGIQSWPDAALVHTRLSIIDLSPAGAQPMANEDGTVWTAFNGEIYNHKDQRRFLEGRGHRFRGHSDTEILPHLYEEVGPEFVGRLRGMFAFAIYDLRRRRLLLARDRFGIKPLFYAVGPRAIAFASEIRALRRLPGVDLSPDPQAVYDFAALFCIPAPLTFFRGIRALEPGMVLEAELGQDEVRCRQKSFHTWSLAPDPSWTLERASNRASELITHAVRSQMESDVPLGTLLSGGIDSSLVSVAAQKALREPLRTFNVRFSDVAYDETWAAVAVARQIGSRHQVLDMDSVQGDWETITGLLAQAGQPFADTSLFAVNAVCRLMRQHVTVALSGDGGDEAFGGYSLYWQLARIGRWRSMPPVLSHGLAAVFGLAARTGAFPGRFVQRMRDLAGADDAAVVQSLFCWVQPKELEFLCGRPDVLPVRRHFERQWQQAIPPGASLLERLSALATEVNTRLILPNDFLFKVDTASMKESLEVRVPMLDEDLVELGLTMPHRLKVKGRTCKLVLRDVAQHWLPEEVANKPKKGFGIPVDQWVNDGFKRSLKDALSDSSCRLHEVFNPKAYLPMIDAFCSGRQLAGVSRQGLYQRAIMLLAVHLALSERVRS